MLIAKSFPLLLIREDSRPRYPNASLTSGWSGMLVQEERVFQVD